MTGPFSATRTTTQLLDALRDPENQLVWEQIDGRYRSVIASFARRLGLGDVDADEVAQQTLSEFVRSYRAGQYRRSEGRLSSWILGIAHNTTRRMLRQQKRHNAADVDAVEPTADEATLREVWTEERDREIFATALATLRDDSAMEDRTLLAFEFVAIRGMKAREAAALTGLSVDQVYVARSRVTRRLREAVQALTRAFEEDQ
ncbi:MAG: sigma-70 family RNA polymerase sigma factor [Phycisphaerales bacterium]|nr:sigma-70 family RNA polymerase sigma factor [Phycisphaerales bacterium]